MPYPAAPLYDGGIFRNLGFDNGTKGWNGFGGLRIALHIESQDDGSKYFVASNRQEIFHFPLQSLENLRQDVKYSLSAWVQIRSGSFALVTTTVVMDDVNFICAATVHATSGCWCLFWDGFVPDWSPAHSRLYFQSNSTDVEMMIDSISLQPFTDDERHLQQEEIIQMDTEEAVSVGRLLIGDYNVPQVKTINRLGKISYQPEEFYSESGKPNVPKNLLWAKASSQWFELARKFEGIKLSSCVNSTVCLSRPARMVVGLRASTANTFIDNGPYREFLFKHFQVASVDEESAAVVLTCLSNKLNVIVFRGMFDLAGSQQGENPIAIFGPLAAKNVVKATLEFIKRLPKSALVT